MPPFILALFIRQVASFQALKQSPKELISYSKNTPYIHPMYHHSFTFLSHTSLLNLRYEDLFSVASASLSSTVRSLFAW
jgi:hypothetical protein